MQAVGVARPGPFWGAGAGVRTTLRSRVGAGIDAAAGGSAGHVTGRGEATLIFALDPVRQRGLAPYAAAGLAVERSGGGTAEYLMMVVGIAAAPRSSQGWFAEVAVGGGVRLAVGLAFRRAETP